MEPVIICHGGAGDANRDHYEILLSGVILAAKRGYLQLKNNQSALDAVVEAAISLENDPAFNSGLGSSLTIEGTVENDAFVMEGEQMRVGAVASVKRFKNPVTVARLVMEKSDHCILSGEGAHKFASANAVTLIDNRELVHQNALNRFCKYKTFREAINKELKNDESNHIFERKILDEKILNKLAKLGDHDTVGAVAMDHLGNLACSTTTGGLTGKAVGRIGDSPLAGSGGWAQNDVCAISTTGHGEQIMRVNLAKHIATEIEKLYQQNDKEVDEEKKMTDKQICVQGVDAGLEFMRKRVNGYGGAICIDKNGEFSARFTTKIMTWAAIDGKKLYYGIQPGEIIEKELTELDLAI